MKYLVFRMKTHCAYIELLNFQEQWVGLEKGHVIGVVLKDVLIQACIPLNAQSIRM